MGAYTPTHREATRILLSDIIPVLNINELPDGRVRFSWIGDADMIDRLAMLGSDVQDLEPEPREPDCDGEGDGRDLPSLRQEPAGLLVVDIAREIPPRMAAMVAALDAVPGSA